jgi:hypothetical protein
MRSLLWHMYGMLCLEICVGLCVYSESVACVAALRAQAVAKRKAVDTTPKKAPHPKGAPTYQNMFCLTAECSVHRCM